MITKKELNEVRFEMFSKGLYNINEKDVKAYIAKKNAKKNMGRIAKLFGFASISAYMLLFNTGSVVIADTTQNPSEMIIATSNQKYVNSRIKQKSVLQENKTPCEVNHKTNSHKKHVSHETKSPSNVDTKEFSKSEAKSKDRENFTINALCASILVGAIGLIYKGVAMLRK